MTNLSLKNLIAIFILASAQAGCQFHGTGTGNPFNLATGVMTSTSLIADETCTTITRCHAEAALNTCRSSIAPLTNFTARLGVQVIDSTISLTELVGLEASGSLVSVAASVERCQTGIRSIDCNSHEANDAYNSAAANPYAEAAGVLGDACLDVFEKK